MDYFLSSSRITTLKLNPLCSTKTVPEGLDLEYKPKTNNKTTVCYLTN